MFIECSAPAPRFGTVLTVVCRLPGASRELRLPGIVRWSARGGFGVQFGMLGARETYAITHLPRKSA